MNEAHIYDYVMLKHAEFEFRTKKNLKKMDRDGLCGKSANALKYGRTHFKRESHIKFQPNRMKKQVKNFY